MDHPIAKKKHEPPPLEHPEICDVWFWDGDFGHVLGCVDGQEERWLVEKGVLLREDDSKPGIENLVVGDAIYRIRTNRAFEMDVDDREPLFKWCSINTLTRVETPRPVWP